MTPRIAFLGSIVALVSAWTARTEDPSLTSYAAHLGAAEATFRLGELTSTRRWLDAAPKEQRGFEWSLLDARLDESMREIRASDEAIWGLDISDDGARIAVGDAKGRVKVFDRATGAELFSAHEHKDLVDDVRFDATGKRLVSASHDRTARVWDIEKKECTVVFSEHKFPLGGAAFTRDGASVISAGYERNWKGKSVAGVVHRWRAEDGDLELTYEGGGNKPLTALSISEDGTRVAVASWDFCAFDWDIAAGGEPTQYIVPDEGLYNAVDCVAYSPDGRRVAYGGKDHAARIHAVATGELVLTLRGHGDNVTGIAYSHEGKRIATSCVDSLVRVFDTTNGELICSMRGAMPSASGLAFSPDDRELLVSTADGRVLIFDATHSNYGAIRLALPTAAYSVRFSPDGRLLASCTYDGRVQLFSTSTFDRVADWQAHERSKCAITLAFADAGRELLSCSYDGTIRRWDAESQAELGKIEFGAGVYHFALAPDGQRIAAALMNKQIALADRETGEIVHRFMDAKANVFSVAFDGAGTRLIAGGQDRVARVYDPATNSLVCETEPTPAAIHSAIVSLAGNTFLTGGGDGVIREFDATNGKELRVLFSGNHSVNRLAYSRDGSRLIGAGQHLWFLEPRSGALVAALPVTPEASWDLEFSPDGTLLATADLDDHVSVLPSLPMRARSR